jgi:hypothetical protein
MDKRDQVMKPIPHGWLEKTAELLGDTADVPNAGVAPPMCCGKLMERDEGEPMTRDHPGEPPVLHCSECGLTQDAERDVPRPVQKPRTTGEVIVNNEPNEQKEQPQSPAAQPEAREAPHSQGALDVLAERRRQIEKERWTPEHDDEHTDGVLALAASCYATADTGSPLPKVWPWDPADWKPKGKRRNLVRAGALILAEIERIDRAALSQGAGQEKSNA